MTQVLNVFAACSVLSNVVSYRSKNCKNHIRVDGSSFLQYNTIQATVFIGNPPKVI